MVLSAEGRGVFQPVLLFFVFLMKKNQITTTFKVLLVFFIFLFKKIKNIFLFATLGRLLDRDTVRIL